jgi:hypothetical protein
MKVSLAKGKGCYEPSNRQDKSDKWARMLQQKAVTFIKKYIFGNFSNIPGTNVPSRH